MENDDLEHFHFSFTGSATVVTRVICVCPGPTLERKKLVFLNYKIVFVNYKINLFYAFFPGNILTVTRFFYFHFTSGMSASQKRPAARSSKHYLDMLDMTAKSLEDFAQLIRDFVDDNADYAETVDNEKLEKFIAELQPVDTATRTLHAKLLQMGKEAFTEQTEQRRKKIKRK